MRAVITRVKSASVSIAGSVVGEIGHGLLILLGVGPDDTPELCEKLADKALGLRIFCDEAGKMNRSLADIGGQVLVVSQFTLYADCRYARRLGKRRPRHHPARYGRAAPAEKRLSPAVPENRRYAQAADKTVCTDCVCSGAQRAPCRLASYRAASSTVPAL